MNEWIEWKWTPEKTYPETLETKIDVKFDDGDQINNMKCFMWYDEKDNRSNFFHDSDWPKVTHYRLASEEN